MELIMTRILMLTIELLLFPGVTIFAALPEPPNQHAVWKPGSDPGIPDYVVRVAASLFDAGLSDPRGLAYRAVELQPRRSATGVRTHGWVFSDTFAVCWDGLVHRVRAVGTDASL